MAEERTQRRLAAILAADVVGYSRLMQLDEAGTLAALKARRSQVLQPVVSEHRGRVVKLMGDGVLVEFASAVDAVECAVKLQRAMDAANAGVPEDRRIMLRVGVNLGDVMVEGSDLYGDGVNIAARLEALAEPGGVLVSQTVFSHVRGKGPFDFADLGEQRLKNMAEPVRAYRVSSPGPSAAAGDRPASEESRISIAILPFANMSGDAEQEYFADGLTEDLITALAKSRHLHVIARNTTFQYKNRAVSVQQVGRELGARYVVEGSVRQSGGRVRVTAQLIDRDSGAHLWAERFDRELADIFAVQDEIVQAISAQLGYALIDAAASGRRSITSSLTAYDYLLRGRSSWRRGAVIETRDWYLKAVDADPNYAAALSAVAFFYAEDLWMQMSGESMEELARLAESFTDRAVAANDGDPYAYHMIGTALLCLGRLKEARHHLEMAVSLNPYWIYARMNLGCVIAFEGQHAAGLEMIEGAMRLEPRMAPAMRAVPLYVRSFMGDAEGAEADFVALDHPLAYQHLILAACMAVAGREEEGRRHAKAFEAQRSSWFDVPGFSRVITRALALPKDRERFLGGLRKLGYRV